MLANRMTMGAAGVSAGGGGLGGIDTYTKLYLPMTGSDEDTVFLDSGINSISSGLLGDACGYFDGTGDYLTVPDHADWDVGSGDFTIEFWIRFSSVAGSVNIVSHYRTTNQRNFFFRYDSSALYFYFCATTTDGTIKSVAWTPSVDTWYHVAASRNGNNLYFFVDGTQVGTTQDVTGVSAGSSTDSLWIGGLDDDGIPAGLLNGFLQELRISNTARYTSNFTPSTTPYTSDAYTKLLLHMDNAGSTTFTDSGNTGHTVTTNGNTVQVSGHPVLAVADAQVDTGVADPWGGYSGVLKLDGTGDILTIPQSADWLLNGDSTIDVWIYTGADTEQPIVSWFDQAASGRSWDLELERQASPEKLSLYYSTDGTNPLSVSAEKGSDFAINTWYHVAVVRNGNTLRFFLDGVNIGGSIAFTPTLFSATSLLRVGGIGNGSAIFSGALSHLRISKGIDRTQDSSDPMYNGGTPGDSFTPPTGPYTETDPYTFITATGGTITEDGDYKVHSFTSSGDFEVTSLGDDPVYGDVVEYLVVAGGGAGGCGRAGGGGGGAGGLLTGSNHRVTSQTYSITVGDGGAAITASNYNTTLHPGEDSVFDTITAIGGGGGQGGNIAAGDGGSGGATGGGYYTHAIGEGTVGQGNDGGAGNFAANYAGGGGGGSGAVGGTGTGSNGGNGGVGTSSSITGSSITYAGGGGGGCASATYTPGSGGTGGGGAGGDGASANGVNGTSNTGGGGGGSGDAYPSGATSGAGGSGVVIIRYKFQ